MSRDPCINYDLADICTVFQSIEGFLDICQIVYLANGRYDLTLFKKIIHILQIFVNKLGSYLIELSYIDAEEGLIVIKSGDIKGFQRFQCCHGYLHISSAGGKDIHITGYSLTRKSVDDDINTSSVGKLQNFFLKIGYEVVYAILYSYPLQIVYLFL
ncbi:unknown [Ruminococcus sp. CAG:624]|nr:unknown [Ruminococcus sp. CAG:624]